MGLCGFLIFQNQCIFGYRFGYHLRFKGFTGLFFVRLCKIVLKRYIRRISEKLGSRSVTPERRKAGIGGIYADAPG